MFSHEVMKRHETEGISVRSLAKELGVHPNTLRRAMIKGGYKINSRSESMKNGYATGNIKKRTGHTISESHRIKLSEANHGRKREVQRKNNPIINNTIAMNGRGASKNREAAKKGSKFERMLIDSLTSKGYNIEHQFSLEKYKIDLYISDYKLAIEVDGISHREPIYGTDKLINSQEKDKAKDNSMRLAGMNILRVRDNQSYPSQFNCRKVTDKIIEVCNIIKSGQKVYDSIDIK